MKLENAWPGVFLFYLKFLWAVTFLSMSLTSTGPDKYRFLRAGRGARGIPAAAALRCPIHLSMPRAVVSRSRFLFMSSFIRSGGSSTARPAREFKLTDVELS